MSKSGLMLELRRLLRLARGLNKNPQLSLQKLKERRLFLKHSAQIGLWALPATQILSACAHHPPATNVFSNMARVKFKNSDDPVIILGGGIAGLTAAFYLTQAGILSEIFEASPRLGGRIFTKTGFNSQGMSCELGGELVDSNHEDIFRLCRFFDLPLDAFSQGDQGLAPNLYYFANGDKTPYRYRTDDDAVKMMQIFDESFQDDASNAATDEGAKVFDALTLEQYLSRYRHQVDPWFLEMLRIAYVGECGLDAGAQTALLLLTTLSPDTTHFKLYGDSDQAWRIRGGNQALISALQNWLLKQGVLIHTDSPLTAISETSSGLALKFLANGAKLNVSAHRSICTLPFSVLQTIDGLLNLPLDELKKSCIREMTYGTNGKIMQGYRQRIWRDKPITESGPPPSNGMVYTNQFVQNVWETSRMQMPDPLSSNSAGILTTFLGGKDGAQVSVKDLAKSLKGIAEIFPGTEKLYDQNSAVFNWTNYKFNLGSYASARPNQLTRFGSIGGQAELNGKLQFAGEHVAPKFAGYMNGACLSGKLAAMAILGVSARAAMIEPAATMEPARAQ